MIFRRVLTPLLLLILLVVAWQIAVPLTGIDHFLLPTPSEIFQALLSDRDILLPNAWTTLVEIVLGFAIAVGLGSSIAITLHLSTTLRHSVYPLLIASQTLPVVVLAPILVILLGYNIGPKLVVVALTCFFPVVVNTVDGLRSVNPELIDVMRTLHASRKQLLRRVEVPWSLPYFFSGVRVAATVAAIGAIFGEWVGSSSGLGYIMLQSTAQLETARVFAAVVILALFAGGLFAAVVLAEHKFVPWSKKNERS